MPVVIAICALIVVAAFAAAARAQRRLELRADLLDLIASACRRGAPLGPLLEVTAAQVHWRRRDRLQLTEMAAALREGRSLSDALAGLDRRVAPMHVVHAVRAAEGTSRLPAVLEAVAADTGEALGLRHRLRLASLYPILLTVLVLGLHLTSVGLFREIASSYEVTIFSPDSPEVSLAVGLVLVAGAVVVGLLVLDRFGRLPGSRRLGQARLLHTGALLLEAGLPLGEAFERAAGGSGHPRVESSARGAVHALEEGAPPEALWSSLGLPASDRVRLLAAGSRLPAVLTETAARCLNRWRYANASWMRLLRPATVVVVGALVFLDFRIVMGFLQGVLQEARGAVSLW